jgi:hypothetical protein
MNRTIKILRVMLVFLLTSGSVASAAGLPLDTLPLKRMEDNRYFLGCNLHADMQFNKVSSVNYQLQGGLLPWGTEVRVIRVNRNNLLFEVLNSGRRYHYEFYRKTRRSVPLVEHLERIFLESSEGIQKQVASLAELDKDGIYEGRVKPGMSREGVLIAIGYPPEFANRKALMTARQWSYWVSRYSRMVVSFGRDGRVTRITGDY